MDNDDRLAAWRNQWTQSDHGSELAADQTAVLDALAERLADNYPFDNPVYAGQMLKPPHPLAIAAYAMAMEINPNNHALDGGPATAALERECIDALFGMVGFDRESALGHLTSSGTIANLEALWVARELHPDKAIASSSAAHYTHSRMCGVLGVRHVSVRTDMRGRMTVETVAEAYEQEPFGTIVVTLGTTSLGAIDDLPDIFDFAHDHGIRIHVDAAYGGFFRLLADGNLLGQEAAAAFRMMGLADSIVIDPHKHGLQPYGCGSVLFRNAAVGELYKHDSPYTYFTSKDLHLGEISLECSRAGAAAAAFWATLQAFPLATDGLGRVLAKTRGAAVSFARLVQESEHLRLLTEPELDIVCFYPAGEQAMSMSAISAWTERIFAAGMHPDPDAFYLAKLTVKHDQLTKWAIARDAPTMTVLRSVLMKPEHLAFVPELFRRIEAAAIATAL
jgi:glutamate/tyrosine decarboxylase-like PLP-dependent enzyme